jgi:hypothetical protein
MTHTSGNVSGMPLLFDQELLGIIHCPVSPPPLPNHLLDPRLRKRTRSDNDGSDTGSSAEPDSASELASTTITTQPNNNMIAFSHIVGRAKRFKPEQQQDLDNFVMVMFCLLPTSFYEVN